MGSAVHCRDAQDFCFLPHRGLKPMLLNSSFRGLSKTDLEMWGWAELGSRGCGMQHSRLAGNLLGCPFF